jgi:hypothetical protein
VVIVNKFVSLLVLFFLLITFSAQAQFFQNVQGKDAFKYVFNEKAVGHDLANTYLLMYTSLFAYENQLNSGSYGEYKSKFKQLFEPLGIYRFNFVSVRKKTADTQAVVVSNDKVVIVAFRGSEMTANGKFSPVKVVFDWLLTDFNFFKKRIIWWGFGVKVHRGFYTAMDICYKQLKDIVAAHLQGTEKKLWITGHSLGAGIAPLFAYRLSEDGFDVQGIYTFAGPRVGNAKFCERYKARFPFHQRWVHDNDLVTRLPFKKMNYQHFVAPNNIYADGSMILADEEMKGRGKASTHVPSSYIKSVYNLLPLEIRDRVPSPPSFRGEAVGDAALEREFEKLMLEETP